MCLFSTDYTAQQYFERKGQSQFPNAQAGIATTCLTYLSFDVFGMGRDDYKSLRTENPFLYYAARHWGYHARGQEESVKSLALDVFQDSFKVACAADVSMGHFWGRPVNYSGMHISSFFGLAKIIEYQLENGAMADLKGSDGKSPLSIAAERGHEAVVELLLARDDVDVNSDGGTPLSLAAEKGHDAVVKLLLARDDIDVNSRDRRYGQTPLLWAAQRGRAAVVKQLLARDDVDVDPNGSGGGGPGSFAAGNGRAAVVKLLLARDDVNVNSKDRWYGQTPLSWAAKNGHEAVVTLLLARDGVDVNSKDVQNRTPLLLAGENGHEGVVKLLLARDVKTPLS